MEGWVKLHRCLIDKPIFDNANLLKVWIWCLCKATHKPHIQIVGLRKIELTTGQFITGRNAGATELKLKPSTFWDYMQFLKDNKSININSNSKYSVVTVENWGLYQFEEDISDSETDNKPTTNRQPSDTNKNVKNGKNEKKYIFSSLHSQLAELLVEKITANKPNFKAPSNIDSWANEVRLMMENDKRTYEQVEAVINWCQKDSFWKSNILSIKKLREKFDQLESKMQGGSKFGANKQFTGQAKTNAEASPSTPSRSRKASEWED